MVVSCTIAATRHTSSSKSCTAAACQQLGTCSESHEAGVDPAFRLEGHEVLGLTSSEVGEDLAADKKPDGFHEAECRH